MRLAVFDQNRAGYESMPRTGSSAARHFPVISMCLGGIDNDNPLQFTNFQNDITPFLEMRRKGQGRWCADVKKDAQQAAKAPEVLFPAVRAPDRHGPARSLSMMQYFLKSIAAQ